jgi:hypothetical protein
MALTLRSRREESGSAVMTLDIALDMLNSGMLPGTSTYRGTLMFDVMYITHAFVSLQACHTSG